MELDVLVRHDRAKLYIETVLPLDDPCIPSIFIEKDKKYFQTMAEICQHLLSDVFIETYEYCCCSSCNQYE